MFDDGGMDDPWPEEPDPQGFWTGIAFIALGVGALLAAWLLR